jgi:Secretion system C-terminal sorting domain
MKTKLYLSFFTLLLTAITIAQTINFTDSNLKNALLAATATGNSAGTGTVTDCSPQNYITIDANGDGEIQQSEASVVTSLNIGGSSISNFTGIEYFTNLKCLIATNNPITTLNLATLTQLESLTVYNCQLTSINLTGLVSLKYLNCSLNQITNLDFSGLPNLQFVYCVNNLIGGLDFTANPSFEKLRCGYNPNLTSLKIKNGKMQLFPNSSYCLFDGNPNLHYICADAAEIPILQSFQATCAVNNTCVINSACALGVEGFNEREVSVFPNPVQNQLSISNEEAMQYELFTILGAKIQVGSLAIHGQVDCSGLAKGLYLLKLNKHNGESKVVKVVKE